MTKRQATVFRVFEAAVDGGEKTVLSSVPVIKVEPTGPDGPDVPFYIPPEVLAREERERLLSQQLDAGVGTHASRVQAAVERPRKGERI